MLLQKFVTKIEPAKINDTLVEQVSFYKYLSSIITEDSEYTTDIKTRMAVAK